MMRATEHVDICHDRQTGLVVIVNDARGSVPVWWGSDFEQAAGWAERFRLALDIEAPVRDLVTVAGHG